MAFHIKLNAQPMLGWISLPNYVTGRGRKLPNPMVA
jgi:hypothetical protein